MADKAEFDLDAALTALAREASSAPSPELVARVIADSELTMLGRDLRMAAPRPGPDLVARVLADAAGVTAARPAPARARRRPGVWTGLRAAAFGWSGGAVAAMVLALAVGLGIGLETDRTLPLLDTGGAAADPMSLALLDADLMLVDGL